MLSGYKIISLAFPFTVISGRTAAASSSVSNPFAIRLFGYQAEITSCESRKVASSLNEERKCLGFGTMEARNIAFFYGKVWKVLFRNKNVKLHKHCIPKEPILPNSGILRTYVPLK